MLRTHDGINPVNAGHLIDLRAAQRIGLACTIRYRRPDPPGRPTVRRFPQRRRARGAWTDLWVPNWLSVKRTGRGLQILQFHGLTLTLTALMSFVPHQVWSDLGAYRNLSRYAATS